MALWYSAFVIMSLDEFTDAVSRSALGTNNPVYTRQMAEHSLSRVKELKEWSFFNSPLCFNAFNKPLKARKISVQEQIVITHLLKENGRIAGAAGFSLDDGIILSFNAKSVILCSSAGGFKPNGFPICDLTHDGTIMAYAIGAKVTGKEWNDGHPGQAINPADWFNEWHGMFERIPGINGIEVHHDLGVETNYTAYISGNPVKGGPGMETTVAGGPYRSVDFLDVNRSGGREESEHGPKSGNEKREGSKDGGAPGPGIRGAAVGGSSTGIAIHKSEGLVPINEKCESTVPGLYAAGAALGSYMVGSYLYANWFFTNRIRRSGRSCRRGCR